MDESAGSKYSQQSATCLEQASERDLVLTALVVDRNGTDMLGAKPEDLSHAANGGVRIGAGVDRSSAQVTVYKSTGHAVEDFAAASVALDAAIAMGRGRILPSAQTTDHPKE